MKELGVNTPETEGQRRSVTLCGSDKNVVKTVSVVEMVKRESCQTLHQTSVISKDKKGAPQLTVVLSLDRPKESKPVGKPVGYQLSEKK
jgi:hypothetical protein